ncbi:MAG: GGDEF domain-containing protein [Thermoguttaceae bacterium]
MPIGFVDFLLSSLLALLLTLTGWFGITAWRLSKLVGCAPKSATDEAELVLARLRDLAAGVAANVGEHNSQVEAINSRLMARSGGESAVVVNAVSQLLAANTRMQQQLDSAEQQLRQQAEEIKSQTEAARTDALTGLGNRRVFDDSITALIARFEERGTPFAVTILDVDHFKRFNDMHGHQVGDLVLQHAAKVYVGAVPATDIVTRIGGEEFAVIHPAVSIEEAAQRADAVRKALDDSHLVSDGQELHVTVSLGVAEALAGETVMALIERADAALYAAKKGGRNRTCWHDGAGTQPFRPAPPAQPAPPAASASLPPASPTIGIPTVSASLIGRTSFLAALSESIASSEGKDAPTVFLVQPDRLKEHSARYGDGSADRLLDAIATVLLAVARKHGTVARFDAQTFAVLVTGYAPIQAMTMAEQIRKLSQQCPLPTPSGPVKFSLSIGTAQAAQYDDAISMVERAEAALESALRAGGNCSFFHSGNWTYTAECILAEAGYAT